jgi:hypothetical protein
MSKTGKAGECEPAGRHRRLQQMRSGAGVVQHAARRRPSARPPHTGAAGKHALSASFVLRCLGRQVSAVKHHHRRDASVHQHQREPHAEVNVSAEGGRAGRRARSSATASGGVSASVAAAVARQRSTPSPSLCLFAPVPHCRVAAALHAHHHRHTQPAVSAIC